MTRRGARPDIGSEFARWIGVAEAEGWSVTFTRRGHLRWSSPAGRVVITPRRQGERNGVHNARAQLRQAGLRV